MPKKKRKNTRKTLISKDWKAKDGIVRLPPLVQDRVKQVLERLKIGEDQQANFFGMKFTSAQNQLIAYELSLAGVSYQDIGALLGVTIMGAYKMLERARAEVLSGLPPQWLSSNFVDVYQAMRIHAAWSASKSEGAIDDGMAATHRRNAIAADGKAGELLLKAAEEVNGAIKANHTGSNKEKPEASNRIGMMQWVFENKILPKLEPPKPAEPVEIIELEVTEIKKEDDYDDLRSLQPRNIETTEKEKGESGETNNRTNSSL